MSNPDSILAYQWRQMVNGATDTAIISTDPAGMVTSWNVGARRILGWTEAEMIGETLERIFTEEDRNRGQLAREIEDAVSIGRGGEQGWRVRKDGTRFWAIGELTPIHDGFAQIVGFIKILRDQTAQRRADEQIREERAALAIQNRVASALALENDRSSVAEIIASASVELTDAEVGAFFFNPTDPKSQRESVHVASGAEWSRAEVSAAFRSTRLFATTIEDRSIVRSDDITPDARNRVSDPGESFELRSYVAVPVVCRSGAVMGGVFVGHSTPGVFTERDEARLIGLAAEGAVAMDNALLTQELKQLNFSLEQQVIERTEQLRKNEEALRQAQKIEAIGQLTGGIAHDFNNLLQVIIGNLETLGRDCRSTSRGHRALESAALGAKRAAALTQRLLAFSRRQPLNPKPIEVNALISGMSDLMHRTLGEIINIETVGGAGLWRVEVDPIELEAAILNLAVNARDAMEEGGRLTLETANADIDRLYAAAHAEVIPGQYVSISVSDTGTGMSADTVSKAFEPFFTTKPVGQGTGLGLSQVYGFVKQSGGHVKIYSELGEGTTVKIYLPRWLHDGEVVHESDKTHLQRGVAGETILVIEDDDDVREYSVSTLRDLGYRVIEAHDGPSALRLLERQFNVDLLFTDVILPGGLTGAQLAAEARKHRPEIKILFTTGYARNAIIHQGRLDKGVELLTKPFTVVDLAARVRDILDGARESRPV